MIRRYDQYGNFYANNITIDENSYKNIFIYYIGYVNQRFEIRKNLFCTFFISYIQHSGCIL